MPRFAIQAQTLTVGPNLLPRSNMRWARPRCLPRRCIAAHVDCGGETSLEAALGARARARAATASRRQTTSRRRDDGLLHRRAEARAQDAEGWHEGAAARQLPGAAANEGWLQAARDRGH